MGLFYSSMIATPPKQDTAKHMQSEKPQGGKVKSSYLAVKETHINGNHSWDSDSDREEEPVSHSRQQLTPRQKNSTKANHQQKNTEHEAVTEGNDKTLSLQTCCVPLDTEKQITG